MNENSVSKGCKAIGKYLILGSLILLFSVYLFPCIFFEHDGSDGNVIRTVHVWLFAMGGIGTGCLFRWLGSFVEPKEPKDP